MITLMLRWLMNMILLCLDWMCIRLPQCRTLIVCFQNTNEAIKFDLSQDPSEELRDAMNMQECKTKWKCRCGTCLYKARNKQASARAGTHIG